MRFGILNVRTDKKELGNFGEKSAVRFLKRSGYKILERNFECDEGEVDIICRDKTTIAFVEVKTRTVGRESPLEARPAAAVTLEKQKKLVRCAALYGGLRGRGYKLRLDIIELYVDGSGKRPKVAKINHLVGAFDGSALSRKQFR